MGKKIDVAASYFFNNSNLNNNETINRQNFITKDSTQYYDENTLSNTVNYNNRANVRITYKIDSSNTILFTSSLNFQNNKSSSDVKGVQYLDQQDTLSKTVNNINTNTAGNNLSNNLLFRHAFPKKRQILIIWYKHKL